ncbi:hypothetical protein GCM10019059_22670 [Camelimonas fluminis]|nr:hypothetical protein GCM10019059_22670 [Camelimonas fluminis]
MLRRNSTSTIASTTIQRTQVISIGDRCPGASRLATALPAHINVVSASSRGPLLYRLEPRRRSDDEPGAFAGADMRRTWHSRSAGAMGHLPGAPALEEGPGQVVALDLPARMEQREVQDPGLAPGFFAVGPVVWRPV